ncbi:MAG: cardiolipin synthase, partial [Oscillospiraceae bacterium]|nr:cardiolipin synthase [Oscillospiraceae bacterium]
SIYINTPYLNPDNELMTALITSAKCGVDVRIVVPHIPDKKFVHALTKSYYPVLVEAGVKIYEYTPGFMHAKTIVIDQECGMVGTINLDYRSLFLHYECAVWMYRCQAIHQLYEDYCAMLPQCEEITVKMCRSRPFYTRLRHSVLRVFAPMI